MPANMRLSQRDAVPVAKLRTTFDLQIKTTQLSRFTDGAGNDHLHLWEPEGPFGVPGAIPAKLIPAATPKLGNRFLLILEVYRDAGGAIGGKMRGNERNLLLKSLSAQASVTGEFQSSHRDVVNVHHVVNRRERWAPIATCTTPHRYTEFGIRHFESTNRPLVRQQGQQVEPHTDVLCSKSVHL